MTFRAQSTPKRGRGRPPLEDPRGNIIATRWSGDELSCLDVLCEKWHQKRSDAIRNAVIECYERHFLGDDELAAMNELLRRKEPGP